MKSTKIPEGTPFFENINPQNIPQILHSLSAVHKNYGKKEGILWEGDTVTDIGILLCGSALSLKTDITGKQVIVTLIKPGSYIGVLLAADQGRRSPVTVQAAEASSVLFIPCQNLLTRNNCPEHALLLHNLLQGIAEKALVLHERNDCLIKPSIRAKVLTFLSLEADKAGSRSFSVPLNRAARAEYLDVDRSALSRELSHMKADGLIDYNRSYFHLLK